MAESDFLCARCARHTKTCCQDREIYTTRGDVERIADHTGRRDFFEFLPPRDPAYLDQDDDPLWRDYVFQLDGTRRVLRQQPTGDCVFLGSIGCVLPLEVRPLACRLYPYDYTEQGILPAPTSGCPVELLAPGQELMEALNMPLDDARRWHEMLYREIRLEERKQLTVLVQEGNS